MNFGQENTETPGLQRQHSGKKRACFHLFEILFFYKKCFTQRVENGILKVVNL
jgi:hypothetical protein